MPSNKELENIAKNLLKLSQNQDSETPFDADLAELIFDDIDTQITRYKHQLLQTYAHTPIDRVYDHVNILHYDDGNVIELTFHEPLQFPRTDLNEIIHELSTQIDLIHGVGTWRKAYLHEQGYRTLFDLQSHPKWKYEAEYITNLLTTNDRTKILRFLTQSKRKNTSLELLKLATTFDPNEILVLDIETLGLWHSNTVFMIGLGLFIDKHFTEKIFFCSNQNVELELLDAVKPLFQHKKILISYNGKSFDIPVLLHRFSYNGLEEPDLTDLYHLDLLHYSRKFLKPHYNLNNCRLSTLETEILGMHRQIDIPSAYVPEFYLTYEQTQNIGPLIPIIEHNVHDIKSLILLLEKILNCENEYE